MNRFRVWLASALVTMCMLAGGVVLAPSASADSLVEGCHLATCVDAYTGGKNYSNHTQWVGWVNVYKVGAASQVQTWGDGFYYEASGSNRWFYVGRWVRSGTYVCGASVYAGTRQIACIGISV